MGTRNSRNMLCEVPQISETDHSPKGYARIKTWIGGVLWQLWALLLFTLQAVGLISRNTDQTSKRTKAPAPASPEPAPDLESQQSELKTDRYSNLCNDMWAALQECHTPDGAAGLLSCAVESPGSWKQRKDQEAESVNQLDIRGTHWNALEVRRVDSLPAKPIGPQTYDAVEQFPLVSCKDVVTAVLPLKEAVSAPPDGMFNVSLQSPRKIDLEISNVPHSERALYKRTKDALDEAKAAMVHKFRSVSFW